MAGGSKVDCRTFDTVKIRTKLFLALVLVVAGGTAGTLVLAERQFQSWVRTQVLESFERDIGRLLESRQERLAEVREVAMKLAKHDVVARTIKSERSQVSEEDREVMQLAYTQAIRPMRGLRGQTAGREGSEGQAERPPLELPLMGVVGLDGDRVFLSRKRGRLAASWKDAGEHFAATEGEALQVVGYGLVDGRDPGEGRVKEVVVTPVEVDGEWAGWFFLGRDAGSREERVLAKFGARESWTGLWVDGEWFAEGVDPSLSSMIEKRLDGRLIESTDPVVFRWQDEPYLLLARELNPESPLGRGAQVAVFSLARLDDAVEHLRWGVALLGVATLLLTILVAWWLSRRFSGPILRLVEATQKVREGRLDWKVPVTGTDEFATLATNFNRMTEDLSLKEKYHDLLGKTSDPVVARRLTEGSMSLGGELRHAAVVFCDIRGFTAMTDGMAPSDVIHMLNHHMTAMTRVIHAHGGVVDKFVGDLVMGVFGAPVSREDDVARAAACATGMIRARAELNGAMGEPVEIGVGLAAGEIVSGLMGSEDRLNYTVLGDRVNLAARLCSLAGSGEVLVDEQTAELLGEDVAKEPRGTMEVRGFRSAVGIWSLVVEADG